MDISYGFSNSSNKMIKKTFSHCWFLYSVSILAALLGSIVDGRLYNEVEQLIKK